LTHRPKWRALSAYHAGALGPDGRRRVEQHLATCEPCTAGLARIEAYDEVARTVRAQRTPPMAARLGAEAAVVASLAGEVRNQPNPEVPETLGAKAAALTGVFAEAANAETPVLDWAAIEAGVFAAGAAQAEPVGPKEREGEHEPKWRALLAYHEGALSDAGRARLEAHLASCRVCQRTLASMGTYDEVADALQRSTPEVAFERIEPSLRRASRRPHRGRWLATGAGVLAAAAAFALLVRPAEPSVPVATSEPVAEPLVEEASPLTATVVAVGGDVRVAGRAVDLGAALDETDAVTLAPDAAVHVRLASGTGFALAGAAELALSRLRDDGIELELRRGRVQSQVRTGTPYSVRAGPYVVRVRGTRFEVRREGDDVAVTVDEGVVEVLRDGALVALLPAPAQWSSRDGFQSSPQGSVRAPWGLSLAPSEGADVQLAPTDRLVRWEIGGATFVAAGGLAMRAPPGPLALTAIDAQGRRHDATVEVAAEGALVEDTVVLPEEQPSRRGTLRPEDIQSVVRPSVARMQRCYERILRRMNPELEGSYALRVTVQRDGSVRRVRVVTDADAPPPFVACLETIARRWRFPSPEGGPTATFRLPLRFDVSAH